MKYPRLSLLSGLVAALVLTAGAGPKPRWN